MEGLKLGSYHHELMGRLQPILDLPPLVIEEFLMKRRVLHDDDDHDATATVPVRVHHGASATVPVRVHNLSVELEHTVGDEAANNAPYNSWFWEHYNGRFHKNRLSNIKEVRFSVDDAFARVRALIFKYHRARPENAGDR